MRYAKPLFLAILLTLTFSGCYTTRMVYPSSDRGGGAHNFWSHSLFWGIVPLGKVNLEGYCGDAGVYSIKTQIGGVGLLANWLTAGIWTPMHVRVVCASPNR